MKIWQVDSFSNEPFKGNPAAVVLLDRQISDELMLNIAKEMNLSETAFILLSKNGNPLLRWFTPMFEIDLCGHATLAAAHIYMTEIKKEVQSVTFDTKFVGELNVQKEAASYVMNFPVREGAAIEAESIPSFVFEALSKTKPKEIYKSRDLMLVYDNAQIIRDMKPDFNTLMAYKDFIIVTARSDVPEYDFVSRFFCADDGIAEDPVTGSAHCTLAPYWGKKLNKDHMQAYQCSERGGALDLRIQQDRVLIKGSAVTVLEGSLRV
ncbi:MAG: hypothetical protein CMH30_02080 [Micavibrio sp.]|nr:hypothetical protein [Micavibrio sp.]|tara:strand:+ start:863 stop:1657 length:795 start_codon:yes stop_codon:yes gene_type:complete